MVRALNYLRKHRDWRILIFAGVLGFIVSLAVMEILGVFSVSLNTLSVAMAAIAG